MFQGSCAYASVNNLLKCAGSEQEVPEEVFTKCFVTMNNSKTRPKGSGPKEENPFGSTVDDYFEMHVCALRQLFSCYLIKIRGLRATLRLQKCMHEEGNWKKTRWLSQQTQGLYLVFGHLDGQIKKEGHYVAGDASNGYIYDSFSCRKYDFCHDSFLEIFPLGIDCAHELIITYY